MFLIHLENGGTLREKEGEGSEGGRAHWRATEEREGQAHGGDIEAWMGERAVIKTMTIPVFYDYF